MKKQTTAQKKEAAEKRKKADLVKLKMIVDQKVETPEDRDKTRQQLAEFLFGEGAQVV